MRVRIEGQMLVYRVANYYAAVMMRPFRIEFEGMVYPLQHEGTLSR